MLAAQNKTLVACDKIIFCMSKIFGSRSVLVLVYIVFFATKLLEVSEQKSCAILVQMCLFIVCSHGDLAFESSEFRFWLMKSGWPGSSWVVCFSATEKTIRPSCAWPCVLCCWLFPFCRRSELNVNLSLGIGEFTWWTVMRWTVAWGFFVYRIPTCHHWKGHGHQTCLEA